VSILLLVAGCAPVGYGLASNNEAWQMDGLYCDGTKNLILNAKGPAAWFDEENAASPPSKDPYGNQAGAIGFPMIGVENCTCNSWRMDFVSPDVSTASYWQDLKSVSASLLDTASMQSATPLNAQLMLLINKQTDTYLIQKDASGKAVFCPLGTGQWTNCNAAISSTGYTVLNIVVRIYGQCAPPGSGFYEGGIFLDSVIPWKQ